MASYTKKAVMGFAVIFTCLVLANVASYLLRLVLARSLSPGEFGLVYAIFALFGFVLSLQTLGLDNALVWAVPRLKGAKVKSAFLTVVYTQLAVMAAVFIATLLLAPWLADSYFHHPEAAVLVVIFGVSILLSPLEVSLIGLFQGLGMTHWYGYMNLLRAAFLLACTALLLWLGFGIAAPILAYLLVYLLIPIVYLPLLLKAMPGFRTVRARYDPALLRRLLRFGLPMVLTTTIGVFLTYIDTFFITLYRTLPEVGLYNVALPTAGLMWFFSGAIYNVMMPISSELGAKRKTALLADSIGRIHLYLFIVLLPFAAVLLLFPDIIINALFGSEYIAAAATLQVLVVGGLFYSFAQLSMSVILGLGESKLIVRAMFAAAAVNVLLDIILIPEYGIIGSAYATLVAFIMLFAVNLVMLRRLVAFRLPYGRMLRGLLAAAMFTASIIFLRSAIVLPLWWKIAAVLGIAGALYAALLFLLRVITIDELKRLSPF